MSDEILRETNGELLLRVLVVPRASKSAVAGLHDGRLKVRIAAPPVDGAANKELVRFLAGELGAARSQVGIDRGASGKRKTVRLSGLTAERVRARLRLRGGAAGT